ncbi:MAG: metallophosphoesterase, partial [Actinobacteria bacterium]|nr:metallophosphoesterase [Actinomycetota bacterium]
MRATLLGRHKGKLLIVLAVLAIALLFSAWPAAAAPDTTYYIGFTSDVHSETGNLQTWLNSLKSTTSTLNHMVFGGDYAGWTTAESCVSILNHDDRYPGTPAVLVRGNHETSTHDMLQAKGLVYNGPDYAIYALDNVTSEYGNGKFDLDEIESLEEDLSAIPGTKPVFVAAHCPVHANGSRITTNAAAFVEAVNAFPNAIVLWGHNHTVSDPGYGTVKKAGDKLVLTNGGPEVPINFTYASFGAMKEGANKNTYGMLATISKVSGDAKVDFVYKNLSGATVSSESITIPAFTGPGTVTPGTSPAALVNTNQSSITSNSVTVAKDTLVLVTVA